MNNQLTTIAALPNGAGQAAALPAEVGEAKPAYRVGEKTLLYFNLPSPYTVIPQVCRVTKCGENSFAVEYHSVMQDTSE
jgi:hypothetical protein